MEAVELVIRGVFVLAPPLLSYACLSMALLVLVATWAEHESRRRSSELLLICLALGIFVLLLSAPWIGLRNAFAGV